MSNKYDLLKSLGGQSVEVLSLIGKKPDFREVKYEEFGDKIRPVYICDVYESIGWIDSRSEGVGINICRTYKYKSNNSLSIEKESIEVTKKL